MAQKDIETWETLNSSESEDDFKDLQIVESDSDSLKEDESFEKKYTNQDFQKPVQTTQIQIENDFTPTDYVFNKYPPVPDKPMPIFNFSHEVTFTEIELSRLKELMSYELIALELEKNNREQNPVHQNPENGPFITPLSTAPLSTAPLSNAPLNQPPTPKSILSQQSIEQHSLNLLKTNETLTKANSKLQSEIISTKSYNIQISSDCEMLKSKLNSFEASYKQLGLTSNRVKTENEKLKQKNKQFQLDLGELNTEIIGLNMDLQVDVDMKNKLQSLEDQNFKLAVGFKDLTEKLNSAKQLLENERFQNAENSKLIEINQRSEVKSYELKQEALTHLETSKLNQKIAELEQQIYSASKNLEIELEKQDEEHGVEKLELRRELEASKKEQKKYQKIAETSMQLAADATKQSAGLKKKVEEVEKKLEDSRKHYFSQARLRASVLSAAADSQLKSIDSLKKSNEHLKIDNSDLNKTYDLQKQEIVGLRKKLEELKKDVNCGKRRGKWVGLPEKDDKKPKNDETVIVKPEECEVEKNQVKGPETSPERKKSSEVDPFDYDDFLENLKCIEK